MNTTPLNRRRFVTLLSALPLTAFLPAEAVKGEKSPVVPYLQSLARPDGGYAWPDDPTSALPVTYAALACYRLLGEEPPSKAALVEYVRAAYPPILMRLGDSDPHPMHQFDFEQMQSLVWLGQSIETYRPRVAQWVRPDFYPSQFEPDHVPVFQQEVCSLLCRQLLSLSPTEEWTAYVLSRQRNDSSFNNTAASDGSGGHVSNTLCGMLALQAIGRAVADKEALARWVRACQVTNERITYAPDATLAANDHVAYVWAAAKLLHMLGTTFRHAEGARAYLAALWNEDGGFGDRPGRASNPIATMQALEALTLLGPMNASRPRRAAKREEPLPDGLNVYTIQIEAPGTGSPQIAVAMAQALKIDLWGAKNAKPGWLEATQNLADLQKVATRFFVANEEYGTTVILPGLGTYSHLADVTAPAGSSFGPAMTAKELQPIPWAEFLARRIAPLRQAGGSNVWQYNQNEALTRILLDQAVESQTFSAVSTFHFSDNFLETTPFLNQYRDVLPFLALQDAHLQTWWWMEYLAGFRTLFLAEAPTWEGWVNALARNWVVGVRHEARSAFKTEISGSTEAVRRRVLSQQTAWQWWDPKTAQIVRPWAVFTVVRPEDVFEGGRPETGANLILRCWWNLEGSLTPTREMVRLVFLEVDGARVEPRLVRIPPATDGFGADVYHVWPMETKQQGLHTAVAVVQKVDTGATERVVKTFRL